MSFLVLKEKLKSKLSGIAGIGEVLDYPSKDFTHFPAAIVRTDGNTSQFDTNTENTELYTFTIFLAQTIKAPFSDVKAREVVEELCDTVRDAIDSDEFLSGISMPSGRVILGATPTVSRIYEADEGQYVVAEVEVAIRVSKSV